MPTTHKTAMKHILVTGGAGFIGSHTVLALLQAGYEVSVVDNLSNASRESLNRVETLANKSLTFYQVDMLDTDALTGVFAARNVDAVIHLAGLKSVSESLQKPLAYYQNNVQGSMNLCQVMAQFNVHALVFSSSATVYGVPESLPVSESSPVGKPTNPYGRSKLMVEQILDDVAKASSQWQIAVLRYFNPVGAHESGSIGEDPNGIPDNLMPFIAQVASGKLAKLNVFGDDYPTPDGTGVRDFIHVEDLAQGHVKALAYLATQPGLQKINLGTGTGYSVKELISTFSAMNQVSVPYAVSARREGDLPSVYADVSKAKSLLGWEAKKGIEDMCRDTWRWQQLNPNGYPRATD